MIVDYSHEIRVQQAMVRDLNLTRDGGRLGPLYPCGNDPATGEPLTLREMYHRYALTLYVVAELEARL